uniref:Uncharacterized protein n=1 Tax=Globodera pallida TaxID=36090 RepID=A0A183BNS1_GLOPA
MSANKKSNQQRTARFLETNVRQEKIFAIFSIVLREHRQTKLLDKDSCYCHVGRENQNITFLQKKMSLSDFHPASSFAHRKISQFKTLVIAILLVSLFSAIAHAMVAGVYFYAV